MEMCDESDGESGGNGVSNYAKGVIEDDIGESGSDLNSTLEMERVNGGRGIDLCIHMDTASSAAGSTRFFTFKKASNLSIHENNVWK
ncbi:Acyl-CoA N-acyltransferase with RING/FYVE/PHD-type zinc finger domain-containing protein [Trifolium repens]|nr:Acyl-CoA N-acyltransferase with RING/FYVE/PHD-type zinc finger domain-containing protein [Trifolium repens]